DRLRVMIAQAYHLSFDPKLWREMRPYPPLGSLYAASVVRNAGYEVSFFDSMLSTEFSAWASALDRNRPNVVVLFEDNFNYLTKMCLLRMREAAIEMIASAKRIGARVIVASSDASDHARFYLDAGAEFVIRGEGERAMLEILRQIRDPGDGDPKLLPGVSYLSERGEVVHNDRMPLVRELDKLPFPAWDLINLKEYRNRWQRRHGMFSINLVTTRGCPYHCNWCAKPIWGQRYNSRSPENVVAELVQLSESIDLDHVWFMDDIFGLKPGWVQRFADSLEKHGLRIRFKCLTRSDLLRRPGEIESLARAGCETVWIGAESGSQKILDAMEKGTTVEDIERTSARLREHGIRVGHFIQFGYPGETMREIKSTLAMLRRVMPDELGISVSYPLPGTPFYERVKAQLGETQNWQDSDDLAMLFRGPFTTEFYRCLHRIVHRDLAWRRTVSWFVDGSFFKQRPSAMLRRLALFGLYSVLLPGSWLRLKYLSRSSAPSVGELPTELDRESAATPSDQSEP
ncbi:MAG TPA: radical SAM protein, partial [Gammaproteobacteria bacterium]